MNGDWQSIVAPLVVLTAVVAFVIRAVRNKKRGGGSGPKPDDLFLIHCNINQVRELFETWEDEEALHLLEQLEEECC